MAIDNRSHPSTLAARRTRRAATAAGGRAVFEFTNTLGQVQAFALEVREGLDDLRPAYAVVIENLRRRLRHPFDTGTTLAGTAWDALRDRTVKARRGGWGHYRQPSNEGPERRVLHWTHALRRSLTEAQADGAIADVAPDGQTMYFGTAIEYAGAVNRLRPILAITDAQIVTDVVQPIQQHLLGRGPDAGAGRRRTRQIARTARVFAEAAD